MVCKPGSCFSARATSLQHFEHGMKLMPKRRSRRSPPMRYPLSTQRHCGQRIRWTTVCGTGMDHYTSVQPESSGHWIIFVGSRSSPTRTISHRSQRPRWSAMLLGLPRQPIPATHHCSWVSSVYCWSRCVLHRIRVSPTRSTRSLPRTVSCQSWSSCGDFPAACSAASTCAL